MTKPIFNAPINSVSFGFVGYQLLNQFYKSNIDFDFYPIGNGQQVLDFSSFNKAPEALKQLAERKSTNFHSSYSRKSPVVRLWHIGNSENTVGNGNHLLTFHELDSVTPSEVNVLNNQEQIFVTNKETKEVFESYGVKVPVTYLPLGYDTEHFHSTKKKYLGDKLIVTMIHGKYEPLRKNHEQLIKTWLRLYGNNPLHRLHLHIYNPFFNPEQNKNIAANLLEGKEYSNVNFFGYTKTLGELNDSYNCATVVLDIGNEGWSLPSFHTTGLGKHSLLLNVAGLASWGNAENSVLIEPTGKKVAHDGVFFHQGAPWNQGNFYSVDDDTVKNGLVELYQRVTKNRVNEAGLKLQTQFTWENTFDILRQKVGF